MYAQMLFNAVLEFSTIVGFLTIVGSIIYTAFRVATRKTPQPQEKKKA